MEEISKRAVDKVIAAYPKMSEALVNETIGRAVLALLSAGRDCDCNSLLAGFQSAIAGIPSPESLRRMSYEAARKALLAARQTPPQ